MYTCRHFLLQFGTVLFKRQWILHTRWEKKSSKYWGRQKEHVKGLGVSNTPLNVWQFFIAVPVLPRQSPQPSLGPAALLSGSRSQWAAQGWLWWSNGYKTGGRWWQGMLRTTETITEKYESETAAKKHSSYFDTALEAVELRRERHATNQQCSSHVGEA